MKLALAILAVANYANATKIETEVKAADDDELDCTEWIWEECSWMYYRHYCVDENNWPEYGVEDDCGWFYWDDWNLEEFFVTCDEFDNEWTWCH